MACIWSASKLYERQPLGLVIQNTSKSFTKATFSQAELVALGSNLFTQTEILKQEKLVLMGLEWKLRPVTPYEFMSHIVLYAKLDKKLEKTLLYQSQIVIDFSLCGMHCYRAKIVPHTLLILQNTRF